MFWKVLLRSRKDCFVFEKIAVSRNDCCVLEKIVVLCHYRKPQKISSLPKKEKNRKGNLSQKKKIPAEEVDGKKKCLQAENIPTSLTFHIVRSLVFRAPKLIPPHPFRHGILLQTKQNNIFFFSITAGISALTD